MSVNMPTLTIEQKIEILLKKCETKEECSNWIKYHMKLHLPDCTVSRYSDTNPLDIVWLLYDICVNRNNPSSIEEILIVAGRGSGKCVEKGTQIRLVEGSKNIEDIIVGDTVFTGWSFAKVAQIFDEGIKPGIKIRSLSGCLAVAPHHRIQAVTPDNKIGWVYLKDLKNGDWVYQSVLNTEGHAIRYPSVIIRPFIQDYPEIKINKDLLKNEYIAKNEVNTIYAFFYKEGLQDKMTEIDFILEGHFEKVISIDKGKYYFYDLEIDDERHAYYSNGYISHNTLGMAIAELMIMLHDKRDVVHVGAILSQAKRCYDYQMRFIFNDRMRDALDSDIHGAGPILEKANMEKSVFRLGETRQAVSIEILPCTLKAVNGPHVPLCVGGKTRIILDNSDKSVDANSARQKVTVSASKLYRLIKEGRKLKVVSYNFATGMVESKSITAAYDNGQKEQLKITRSLGKPLWCTLDHKIYSIDKAMYVEASELKIGSKILSIDTMIFIDTIEGIEFIDTKRTVYDFTVQDNHNFFAGGILVHNCVVDEIDTVSGDGLKAFRDISGMIDSRGDQKALRVGISTRKTRYGLMNQQIEDAEAASRTVKKWTVLEFSERCPDSRSGKVPISAFINADTMDILTREQYEMLPKSNKSEYTVNVFPGDGCLRCAIAALCFVPGTLITMADGTFKLIEDVKIGDLIISHTGKERKVLNTMCRHIDESIYEIDRYGTNLTNRVTGEHPFLTQRGWVEAKDLTIGGLTKYNKSRIDADYLVTPRIDFNNIKTLDIVKYLKDWNFVINRDEKIQIYSNNTSKIPHIRCDPGSFINRHIDIDQDLGWLCGMYAAEGHGNTHRTIFSLGQKEGWIVNEINRITLDKFDISTVGYQLKNKERFVGISAYIYSATFYKFITAICGSKAKSKKIDKDILFLNKDFALGFLKGLWQGDGDHGADYDFDKDGDLSIVTISPDLMSQVYMLCVSLGYAPRIRKSNKYEGKQQPWEIYLTRHKKACHGYTEVKQDRSEYRLKNIQQVIYKGPVYNLSVEVDESYIANGTAVHNCGGDSKRQKSKSPMLKPLSDPIKKTRENGPEWAISQLFNLKPSVEGIIYREFDKKIHCKTWSQAWEILVGVPYPGDCTHDIFIRKCHQMQVPSYAGIDWGWSSPSTVVFFFLDARENIYVVRAAGMKMISNPNWIGTIKENWHGMYRCQLYFPDLAMPGDGVEMRKAGLPVPEKVDKTIASGIQTIKKWLKPLGSPAPKMFLVGEFCEPLRNEFELFHFKLDAAGEPTNIPAQKHDHYLDALRYPIYGLLGGNETILSLSDEEYGYEITQPNGSYTEAPSAAVFAKQNGIAFNTEIDKSSLGKVGTLSELDDNEDIDNNSGFLWSF